jgi:hypothetical protein
MMEELLNEVQKTGLSREQAQAAIDSILGFLKAKLPPPLAGALDSLISGGTVGGGGFASEATAILGSLFEKNR